MNGDIKDGEFNFKCGWISLFIRGWRVFVFFFFYIKVVNEVKKNLWSFSNFEGYFVVLFCCFFIVFDGWILCFEVII